MARKKPKDTQSSGPFGPIFLGIVSVLIGAAIAFFQLAGKSPEANPYFKTVTPENYAQALAEAQDPENAETGFFERAPQTVHFIRAAARGGNRQGLLDRLAAGDAGEIVIETTDLNAWLAQGFRSSGEDTGGLFALKPATPVVNATEGAVHIYLPVTLSYFGRQMTTSVIARGRVDAGSDGLRFIPEAVYLGSSPVPFVVGAILQGSILRPFREAEAFAEVREPLTGFTSAEVELNRLVLRR